MYPGRILYLNHDNPNPSGGVRVVYDHVRHLMKNGYRAYVVHQNDGFRPAWFEEDVPVLYCNHQFRLQPDDLVILPEDHSLFLELFRSAPVRKIVFCQNHFYIFEGLHSHCSWESLSISGVMACSNPVTDFIRTSLYFRNVETVHNAISPLFTETSPKTFQVAYMPRKRPLEAQFIRNLCDRLLEPEYKIAWVAIDGMNQHAVAKTLGESALFLSLGRLEGFGLPPLEAMASGCLVVGFTGFGGREYAQADNGLWCAEDDLVGCSNALAGAVRMIRDQSPEGTRLISNALKTAAEYSPKRQEKELLKAIRHFLGVPRED